MFHPDQYNITFTKLIDYLTSPVALESYYILSKQQKLFGLSPNNYETIDEKNRTKKSIADEIKRILETYNFYSTNFSMSGVIIAEITCSARTIILNKDMLMKERPIKYMGQNACLIVTLAHEICHVLIRSKGIQENNFFNTTNAFKDIKFKQIQDIIDKEENYYVKKPFTKVDIITQQLSTEEIRQLDKNVEKESGTFFDLLLTNNTWNFNLTISNFILERSNWNLLLSDFRYFIINNTNNVSAHEEKYTFSLGKAKKLGRYNKYIFFDYVCPYVLIRRNKDTV